VAGHSRTDCVNKFLLRERSCRLYSLGRLCRLAQNICLCNIPLMDVPLYLEISGKMNAARFSISTGCLLSGYHEKSKRVPFSSAQKIAQVLVRDDAGFPERG